MTSHIYRYEVPVNDKWHTIKLSGPIIHVACRRELAVEFWVFHHESPHVNLEIERDFRVFGTGQPLPDDYGGHIGTAITPNGEFVWHLFRRDKFVEEKERRNK